MSIKTLALALALASGLAGAGLAGSASETDAPAPTAVLAPITNLPSDQSLISGFYKAKVYDQGHYKVGEIKDMLFDQNGTITAVLLSVGGFLGIGEKDVAVPLDSIKVIQRNGRRWLSVNVTKQDLRDAPAYVYDHRTAQWQPNRAEE
jgi:sporulation protein YlmC with PRC-barrel domain